MAGEKRFRTSLFGGFNKSDVNAYIEKILEEFDQKLKDKDKEINYLKAQHRDIRLKYEELNKKADQINEDRAKIADVLIKAQEKADIMMEDARQQAVSEKKKLEEMIEKEREKLVDIKGEIKTLKTEVISTLKKYEGQLNALAEDVGADDDAEATEEEETIEFAGNNFTITRY